MSGDYRQFQYHSNGLEASVSYDWTLIATHEVKRRLVRDLAMVSLLTAYETRLWKAPGRCVSMVLSQF